jgi:hypothetical protein
LTTAGLLVDVEWLRGGRVTARTRDRSGAGQGGVVDHPRRLGTRLFLRSPEFSGGAITIRLFEASGCPSAHPGSISGFRLAAVAWALGGDLGGYRRVGFARAGVSMLTSVAIDIGKVGAGSTASSAGQRKGEPRPNMTDVGDDADQVKHHPIEYFRAAARFRTLEAETTTPRVKQRLRALIDEYERLAGKPAETGPDFG